MKKYVILFIAFLSMGFWSCGNDEDPEKTVPSISLSSPATDEPTIDLNHISEVPFSWAVTNGSVAGGYTLYLSKAEDLSSPRTYTASNLSIKVSSVNLDIQLKEWGIAKGEEAIIYWYVKPSVAGEAIPPETARKLKVKRLSEAAPVITLSAPEDEGLTIDLSGVEKVTFSWTVSGSITGGYTLYLSKAEYLTAPATFTSDVLSKEITAEELDAALEEWNYTGEAEATIYWTVEPTEDQFVVTPNPRTLRLKRRPRNFNSVKVTKIWDYAPHNAFTDLIRYEGKYYCTFREGTAHIPADDGSGKGKIRILVSSDGENWVSFALLEKKEYDLRDPKLSITPDGKLMVLMGGTIYDVLQRLTHVSFLDREHNRFSQPIPINVNNAIRSNYDWLWRLTWFNGEGYGVVYSKENNIHSKVSLVKTIDGINYNLVSSLNVGNVPGESTVYINADKKMQILMRREAVGLLGLSAPPYVTWEWKELYLDLGSGTMIPLFLGGPNMIPFKDDEFIIGTRFTRDNKTLTSLFLMNKLGVLRKILDLPSGGDTSYPGLLINGNELWVSYYSSHEGKTSVYLAKIKLDLFSDLN